MVTLTARDPQGRPLAGQRILLEFVSPTATGARLSANDVTTAADGRATVNVTAPPRSQAGDVITVSLTPIGSNFDNTATRTFTIGVTPSNPSRPVASFTFTPGTPEVGQTVSFDASPSTDEGTQCLEQCTYFWDFGGRHDAERERDGANVRRGRRRRRDADRAGPPGCAFAPGDPDRRGSHDAGACCGHHRLADREPAARRRIEFDGLGSTTAPGVSIVEYTWVWGDGSSNTVTSSAQTKHSFSSAATYVVRLTIRDRLGRTATTTVTVPIV